MMQWITARFDSTCPGVIYAGSPDVASEIALYPLRLPVSQRVSLFHPHERHVVNDITRPQPKNPTLLLWFVLSDNVEPVCAA